jgi:hypothetical protein
MTSPFGKLTKHPAFLWGPAAENLQLGDLPYAPEPGSSAKQILKMLQKEQKKSTRRSIFFATEVAVQSNRISG